MDGREQKDVAQRSARSATCIVMVCAPDEADQVSRQLPEHDTSCLITYRRVEDLVLNAPASKVALVILAGGAGAVATRRTVKWLRHRWPGCPITVVGKHRTVEEEMAAREGGAMYLPRPVEAEDLSEIVSHALGSKRVARPRRGEKATSESRGN